MTKTDVANMALSVLSQGLEITDVEDETSEEARAVRTWWDVTVETALRDLKPYWARKVTGLSLIEEIEDGEWSYKYAYPNDAVAMIRIPSGFRVDTRDTKIPYRTQNDTSGTVIFTNKEQANAEIVTVPPISVWPSDFCQAVACLLAFNISPRMAAAGDAVGERAFTLYRFWVAKAGESDFNEQGHDEEPEPDAIRARN